MNLFEERIVCIVATSQDEAFERAWKEAEEYASFHKLEIYPEQNAYLQEGDPLIDGYELWSVVYESPLSLEDFYEKRYHQYEYHPD